MVREFGALVPRQGPDQMVGQGRNVLSNTLGDMVGGLVLETDQHPEPGRAFHQCRYRRLALFPVDQVAFPMARDSTVLCLGGRCEIITLSRILPSTCAPRPAADAGSARNATPQRISYVVRPWPGHRSLDRSSRETPTMMDHQDGLCADAQRSAAATSTAPSDTRPRHPTATASPQSNTAASDEPPHQHVHQPAPPDTHPGRHWDGSLATPWNDAAQSGHQSPHPTRHDQSPPESLHALPTSTHPTTRVCRLLIGR